MIDEIKNQLRLKYKDLRKGMQDSLKQQYDQQIFNNLLKFQDFQQADTVLTYMSTKMEIDTHQIIEYSLNNKKKIYDSGSQSARPKQTECRSEIVNL